MQKEAKFETYKFSNGFSLAWQKTPSENIFAVLQINHGALHEQKGEEGIAHFLEHNLLEGGTSKYTPQQQSEIRDQFGYTNAGTSVSRTRILWGMIASDLNRYLDIASEMVFRPRLDNKVINQQREVVLREIERAKGDPSFADLNKFFWPKLARDRDHTYFVLGEEKVIANVTEDQIRAFHSRGYSPNNMHLMIAGNIPTDLVERVGSYFSEQLPGSGEPIKLTSGQPLERKSVRYSAAPDLINKDNPKRSNSFLRIGIVVPDEFNIDSAALDVTSEILGRSYTTGLKKRIRSEGGMSYDISSSYGGNNRFGLFSIHGKVEATRQEQAIDIIFEELHKLGTKLVDLDLVERAKRKLQYEVSSCIDSNFRKLVTLDPLNIEQISRMQYAFDERPSLDQTISNISTVTPKDILRVTEKYLPTDRSSGRYVLLVRDPLRQ